MNDVNYVLLFCCCYIPICILFAFIGYKNNKNKKIKKIISLKRQVCNYLSHITGMNKKIFSLNLEDNVVSDANNFVDDVVRINSIHKFHNYEQLQYLQKINVNKNIFSTLEDMSQQRKAKSKKILQNLNSFLETNHFMKNKYYNNVKFDIQNLVLTISDQISFTLSIFYRIKVKYNLNCKIINFSGDYVKNIDANPYLLMSKKEFLKIKKQEFYDKANSIIEFANNIKDKLIVKKFSKEIDKLIDELFNKVINNISKIKDSFVSNILEKTVIKIESEIKKIDVDNKKIMEYYNSDNFNKIKKTCNLLNLSRNDFNEYVNTKVRSILNLFGKIVARNETQNQDVYKYCRPYKKILNPFYVEVSSKIFSSAENNPINYVIKYFYPEKDQYKKQIENLKFLIGELETLKEAKIIIDKYKQDYDKYICDVPKYVLDNDEDGFYSKLGLAIIDEFVLNVEYRFTYTSDGCMAQRYFSVSMNEENIIKIINKLENKLSIAILSKEQRAMMTSKLRMFIKTRDNFTCCQCGNSLQKEPNLLLEVDHIIPISKGGITKEDNLQTLCWKCNRSKGARFFN